MKIDARRDSRRLIMILIAAALSAFNIRCFVGGAGLFPGGVTGVTVLLQGVFERYLSISLPFSPVNLLLNLVPAYIGFRYIGKKLTLLSCIFVLLSSVLVDIFPEITLTDNSLLLCVFGGIIGGAAGSLCLNADATGGGTDFISIFLSERRGIDAFNLMLGLNVLLLCVAGLLFGWERALYSIIFQYVSTQVVLRLFTRYQKQTLFIVTEKPDEIYDMIREETHHAATLFRGEGLYEQQERPMLYSVVSRAEVRRLMRKLREIDPYAFVNSIQTQSLSGRFYNRPND